MVLEHVAVCPICGGRNFSPLFSVVDHSTSHENFSLVNCSSCDFLLTNPRPDKSAIGKYYQSNNYISHSGGGTSIVDMTYRLVRKFTLRSKLKIVQQHQPKGTLLDYGCGSGAFLKVCQDAGWKTLGIEPSPGARQHIPGSIEVLETFPSHPILADAITLWHVLEHVHDLDLTLTQLRGSLKPHGTIFIAVPNANSPDAQHYRQHWAAYDAPRHLWHFKKKNMATLLEQKGFKIKQILPMKLDAYYVSLLSEGYKNPTQWLPLRMLSAIWAATRSNLQAGKDNHSSLLYIAQA